MKLSYSQVSLFTTCQRKWYIRYVLKQYEPRDPTLQFGTDVHGWIAAELGGKESEIPVFDYMDDDTNWIAELDNKGFKLPTFDYMDDPALALSLAENLVTQAVRVGKDFGDGILPFAVEKKLDTGNFVGYVDLMGMVGNKSWVVDWKTTDWEYSEHQVLSSEQLTSYAWLVLEKYGIIPDYVSFVTLGKKTGLVCKLSTGRTMDDIDEWREKVQSVRRRIEKGEKGKNPSACFDWGKQCGYYEMCWGEKEVTQERMVMGL